MQKYTIACYLIVVLVYKKQKNNDIFVWFVLE